MIVLSTLHNVLSQAVTAQLHTAALLTRSGQLIAFATEGGRRPKDEVRMVVGVAMEMWQETQEECSMVESELGRIAVVRVGGESEPLLLLALNSTGDWGELETKGRVVAGHLAAALGQFSEYFE
ncbi:hypothetical protein H2248_001287 [Termitomyces sp. 'cryptogamus']|nr:hypothetical protein H2248_001287 [Termitomyces sp. 'cryptogamus']